MRTALIGTILSLLALMAMPASLYQYLLYFDDKVLHLLAFLPLGFLATWARRIGRTPAAAALEGVALACLVGLATEVVQIPLPHRSFEVDDLAADGLGGAAGAIVGGLLSWALAHPWLRAHGAGAGPRSARG
jgi:VanZ family protein